MRTIGYIEVRCGDKIVLKRAEFKKVRCVDNAGVEDKLEKGKDYFAVGEHRQQYDIVLGKERGYWFKKDRFVDVEFVDIEFVDVEKEKEMKKVKCIKEVPRFEKFFKIGEQYEVMDQNSLRFLLKVSNGTYGWIGKEFFEEISEEPNQIIKEVLVLEYDKAFGVNYARIIHQDEKIIKRGEFEDKKLESISHNHPCYYADIDKLFLRGTNTTKDNNEFRVGTDEDLEKLKLKVKAINETYGIKRKSWKEMLEECKGVPFDPKQDNWSVYYNHKTEEVDVQYSTHIEEYNKYISKEDADKIVMECLENQRKSELLKAWKEELESNLKADKKC